MIRKIHCSWYALIMFLFLASCSTGKQYQQPELELPKQLGSVSYADTSSIADIKWKNFFTDPALLDLIQKGIQYNHDLLIALKRMNMANQQVKQAKLLQLPELYLQINGQYNRPSNNSLTGISIKSFLGQNHVENGRRQSLCPTF